MAGLKMRVGWVAVMTVTVFAATGIGVNYWENGTLNAFYCLVSLFFSINLIICYWEACLFWRRDYIGERAEYWRKRQTETGRAPTAEFLASEVPLRKILSPTLWADTWATYSLYDSAYTDRRTYGFNVDIANGFFTAIPSLILYAAFTFEILPVLFVGILGIMLFWQWTYVSSVYWVSFFVAKRHEQLSRSEMYIYIWGANSVWVLSGLLGLYVSIRLIVDGNYSVLGH